MSRPTRKLTMQLTPLLDLLLIVIFAQFIEVQENQSQLTGSAAAAEADVARMSGEVDDLRSQLEEEQQRRQTAEQSADLARQNVDVVRQEQQQVEEGLARAMERQRLLGKLMVELFQVPEEDIEAILDPTRTPPITDSPLEQQRLREKFRQMAEAEPGEMIKHLLAFEEIRKRCDIWELHLDAAKLEVTLDTGSDQYHLPLPRESSGEFAGLDQERFEQELYELLRSLPHAKGLVIVLLTYDRDLRENIQRPARTTVFKSLQQLQSINRDRSNFEFADLGVTMP